MQRKLGVVLLAAGALVVAFPVATRAQILTSGNTLKGVDAEIVPEPPQPKGRSLSCLIGSGFGGVINVFRKGLRGGNESEVGDAFAEGAASGCLALEKWSQRDREALADASQEAFDDPNIGAHDWTAPDSKQRISLVTNSAGNEDREVAFRYYSNVSPPPPRSRVIARPFRTTAVVLLRGAPDERADNVTGRFDAAEVVEVLAHTPDERWAMIGEGGVIIGYAPVSRLASLESGSGLRHTKAAKARAAGAPGLANSSARGAVQTARTMASTQCKSLVATSGRQGEKKESARGCAAPDGKWIVA